MQTQLVYVTVPDRSEALSIARTVVQERLAACANLLGVIESVYWWNGDLQQGEEFAMLLKTDTTKSNELIERLSVLHSYDCPCIICLPIEAGHGPFLEWIQSEVARRFN